MKYKKFKPGDVTDKLWIGDIVIKAVFIGYLQHGKMLFFDKTNRCFRIGFWEVDGEGMLLNGWDTCQPEKALQELHD